MTKLAVLAVAGLAAAASANPHLNTVANGSPTQAINGAGLFTVSSENTRSNTTIFTITLNQNLDYTFGFPNANAFVLNLGGGNPVYVTGLGWNSSHTAYAPSWLSEFRVEFTDNPTTTGVGVAASGTAGPGGPEANSSGGIVDLVGLNLDFTIGDGNLLLTIWDTFNDFGGGVEGTVFAGSQWQLEAKVIPAPGAVALLGLGGLAAIRRRR